MSVAFRRTQSSISAPQRSSSPHLAKFKCRREVLPAVADMNKVNSSIPCPPLVISLDSNDRDSIHLLLAMPLAKLSIVLGPNRFLSSAMLLIDLFNSRTWPIAAPSSSLSERRDKYRRVQAVLDVKA